MKRGEIIIHKIPRKKIMDLAKVIAPKTKKKIIGIRSGEKLHEELLTTEEAKHSKEFDRYFVIEPEFPFWQKDNFKEGKPLPEEFKYSSDTNKEWLTKEELREILKNLEK